MTAVHSPLPVQGFGVSIHKNKKNFLRIDPVDSYTPPDAN